MSVLKRDGTGMAPTLLTIWQYELQNALCERSLMALPFQNLRLSRMDLFRWIGFNPRTAYFP